MQFSCGQCSTRYAVPDEKVRGKRVRTKCRRCGAEILVEGPGVRASMPPSAPPSSLPPFSVAQGGTSSAVRPEQLWTVALDRSDQRKMTTAEFVEAFAAGRVDKSTMVWKHGMTDWLRPFDVPAIAIALRARGFEPEGEGERAGAPQSIGPRSDEPTRLAPPGHGGRGQWDDDEATQVIAPERAQELLAEEAAKVADGAAPPRAPAKAAPPPRRSPPPARQSPPPPRSATPPPAPSAKPPPKPVRRASGRPGQPSAPVPAASRPPAASSRPPLPARSNPPRPGKSAAPRQPASPPPRSVVQGTPILSVGPPKVSRPADPSSFDDEATAVYEPERARSLLEAEAARTIGVDAKASVAQQTETPFAFGYDQTEPRLPPPPTPPISAPPVATASVPSDRHGIGSQAPSIVVAEPPKPKSPLPPSPPAISPTPTRRLRPPPNPQTEKTRLIRVRRKSTGPMFWLALIAALAAAGAVGFYASQLLQKRALPGWFKLP